jgi:hypothetical protein|tara:strand:+ start:148 stop:525 length:378 start_codon:yes stop_codon:yes gene_type:complete
VTLTKGFNPNFDLCLEFGEKYENEFQKIVESKQIEIKTDRKCQKTGNVFVEYESRGKESGIKTTTASYWVFCIWTEAYKEQTYLFIPTRRLKKLIKTKDYKIASGGDNFTSKGFLVPKGDLLELI